MTAVGVNHRKRLNTPRSYPSRIPVMELSQQPKSNIFKKKVIVHPPFSFLIFFSVPRTNICLKQNKKTPGLIFPHVANSFLSST